MKTAVGFPKMVFELITKSAEFSYFMFPRVYLETKLSCHVNMSLPIPHEMYIATLDVCESMFTQKFITNLKMRS